MNMKILIINGPNLNLTGKRETVFYGKESFDSYLNKMKKRFVAVEFEYFQSNHAGKLIDKLQEVIADGIVINPGAYTHTSLALADALATLKIPVVEVHLTNILSREEIRHQSYTGPHCVGIIMGFGLESYRLAVEGLIKKGMINTKSKS